MEHRLGKRINAEMSILLYSCGVPVAIGKTKNIASNGIFVETCYQPDEKDRNIEIAFVIRRDIETEFCHVDTQIVHRAQNGFGLRLDNFDPLVRFPIKIPDTQRNSNGQV